MSKTPASTMDHEEVPPEKKIRLTPPPASSKLTTGSLLCSRIYNLNTSLTKKIIAGLVSTGDGDFTTVVKITDNNNYGICLSVTEWRELLHHFDEITKYFKNDEAHFPKTITLKDGKTIQFKNIYNMKSIILRDEEPPRDYTSNDSVDGETNTKYLKVLIVILQQKTFEGLVNVSRCIMSYVNHLYDLKSTIGKCRSLLVNQTVALLRRHKESEKTEEYVEKFMRTWYYNCDHIIDEQCRTYHSATLGYELVALNSNQIAKDILAKWHRLDVEGRSEKKW